MWLYVPEILSSFSTCVSPTCQDTRVIDDIPLAVVAFACETLVVRYTGTPNGAAIDWSDPSYLSIMYNALDIKVYGMHFFPYNY